ncbi:MAG: glycine oxidase ThiO [Alphaproteobacteria bacterium]|nr:MAG: glycine oxidase ThiO [Alphaproteobacteria bacterium]
MHDTDTKTFPHSDRPRVAVIGAGVCGLGIGWRLAQAGCSVDVFDRDEAGHGATWASAGMLAAGAEAEPGEEALLPLAREAQRRWPDFVRALEADSGCEVDYRDEGTLIVALTHDDVEQLRFTYDYQRGLGIDLTWMTGAEARRREPHLRAGIAAAVYSPADHQVDNRKLVRALAVAFTRAGGRLHERSPVTAIDVEVGRVRGVVLGERRHDADAVVLAAGAWSREIEGLPESAMPPVRPVKGQALALRMDPAAPVLRHVLWAPKIYMVPRRDGRLLIGATVEEKGFDTALTAGGVFELLEAAWRPLPAIEELPIDEMWVGFRPTSRDDAPIFGPTALPGLFLATGHHRNGILLAPVTADMMAECVLSGKLPPEAQPFAIDRFTSPPRPAAAIHEGAVQR